MLSTASTPIISEWSWFATSYLYEPKRPRDQMSKSFFSHGSATSNTASRSSDGVG